ncbi:hypothetical protein JMJ77_0011731 [Colletotrichum scovillei]|uniref:Uncharacterized protein n=1 Tax=Colletotrichum scovillei TaxID=1209932 RepID=A0A9P7QUY6_9PEZI|nr:hypothetical protein JMJ77_0011731 [Colletotrichum scovillei]KAG7046044.1 hypothetical protein JMJ78_0011113 [Colletotrichum scovillei]KAG7063359.1 hypothetical protein JMJ76_0005826 [Colletotrichum scovillei]
MIQPGALLGSEIGTAIHRKAGLLTNAQQDPCGDQRCVLHTRQRGPEVPYIALGPEPQHFSMQ